MLLFNGRSHHHTRSHCKVQGRRRPEANISRAKEERSSELTEPLPFGIGQKKTTRARPWERVRKASPSQRDRHELEPSREPNWTITRKSVLGLHLHRCCIFMRSTCQPDQTDRLKLFSQVWTKTCIRKLVWRKSNHPTELIWLKWVRGHFQCPVDGTCSHAD